MSEVAFQGAAIYLERAPGLALADGDFMPALVALMSSPALHPISTAASVLDVRRDGYYDEAHDFLAVTLYDSMIITALRLTVCKGNIWN